MTVKQLIARLQECPDQNAIVSVNVFTYLADSSDTHGIRVKDDEVTAIHVSRDGVELKGNA